MRSRGMCVGLCWVASATCTLGAASQEVSEHRPVYSPDGTTVVFMRQSAATEGDWELFIADAAGTSARRLTDHVGWDGYAVFSPMGDRFIFDRSTDGGQGNKQPHVLQLPSGRVSPLGSYDGWLSVSDWSAEHGLLAFWERDGQRDLFLLDARGVVARRLTDTPETSEHDAHFAPDGHAIVFASEAADGAGGSRLEVMSTGGGGRRVLVESVGRIYGAAWSPDGARIAFTDAPDDDDADVFLIDVSSGQRDHLIDHPSWDHQPVWNAAGDALLFSSYRSGTERIYRLDLASSAVGLWASDGTD